MKDFDDKFMRMHKLFTKIRAQLNSDIKPFKKYFLELQREDISLLWKFSSRGIKYNS